jgi:glycosyltransferase involved in cell wall biosynthesis
MKVIYCQATYAKDLDETVECIERVGPNVDAAVIVYDQTLTEEQIQDALGGPAAVLKHNIHLVYHEWNDDMPDMRNTYLEKAKELKADWVVVSDPDELYDNLLAQNIKALISEYADQGINLIALHAKDQFDNVEWLDELDLLKETPGGYRETDFWKPLLCFKLYPDTHYEGVGVEGRVHETLKQQAPFKQVQAPKDYFYIHKKSALKIWRNAARNMFVAGGGDNVGEMNPHWQPLRTLMRELDVNSWPEFEALVERGSDNEGWLSWLQGALQAIPTNWGTETRETAKWYYALHKDKLTPEIQELINNPPEMSEEIELENFVTRAYFEILGRPPDEAGKKTYMQAIKSGQLDRQHLRAALRSSPEFQQRHRAAALSEDVKINIPIDAHLNLNEEIFINALKRSGIWWSIIKPKLDVGGQLMDSLQMRKKEFMERYYKDRQEITPWRLLRLIDECMPGIDSIACCIMGYHAGLDMIKETIATINGYVDEIHVQGDDFTDKDKEEMQGLSKASKLYVWIEPWRDNFSEYKNKAISHVNTQWVIIFDHDEIPTLPFVTEISKIITESHNGKKYNIVSFDVIDQTMYEGSVVEENVSHGKPLMHWAVEEPYYGNPHIWLKPGYFPWKQARVPYAYRHVKDASEILERSARNVWLGGGGDNLREKNELWPQLRRLSSELGLNAWNEFRDYLQVGDIDFDLLDLLRSLKELPWKDEELGDLLKYYYWLHPEEEKRYE